jgi:hypothetical protein
MKAGHSGACLYSQQSGNRAEGHKIKADPSKAVARSYLKNKIKTQGLGRLLPGSVHKALGVISITN